MTVGNLLRLETLDFVRNVQDIFVWDVHVNPETFRLEDVRKGVGTNVREGNALTTPDSGIYLMVPHLFRRTSCFRFDSSPEEIVQSEGQAIIYDAEPDPVNYWVMPVMSGRVVPINVRTHRFRMEYLGEIGYRTHDFSFPCNRETRGTIVLPNQTILEGIVLPRVDKITYF